MNDAVRAGADLYLTGDVKYHDFQQAVKDDIFLYLLGGMDFYILYETLGLRKEYRLDIKSWNLYEKDFDFGADKIINFETTLANLLREKFRYEIPHIFFYYPSPQDVLNQTISQ